MKKLKLPNSEMTISALGLGGIVVEDGNNVWTQKNDFIQLLNVCTEELGINYIDSAHAYQRSEAIVGEWLQNKKRSSILIGTKVLYKPHFFPQHKGLTKELVLSSLENSLQQMHTDYVDIYWMHAPDPQTTFEESMAGFDMAAKQGKTRYIGLSNVSVEQVDNILQICEKNNWAKPIAVQNEFNLLNFKEAIQVVDYCEKMNLGYFAYSPLAGGVLTGKYQFESDFPQGSRWSEWSKRFSLPKYWTQESFNKIDQLKTWANSKNIDLINMSLAWILHQRNISCSLIGPKKLEHLLPVKAALQTELTDGDIRYLEELF